MTISKKIFLFLSVLLLLVYKTNGEVVIVEDEDSEPQYVISGISNQYVFRLSAVENTTDPFTIHLNNSINPTLKFSLVAYGVKCEGQDGLEISQWTAIDQSDETDIISLPCDEIKKSNEDYDVDYVFHINHTNIRITPNIANPFTRIKLVATAYYDTYSKEECRNKGYFYCVEPCGRDEGTKEDGHCISKRHRCDRLPSCGNYHGWDETYELCELEYCVYWWFWMYMTSSMLLAVLFILIPSFLVFFLMRRRHLRMVRRRAERGLHTRNSAGHEQIQIGTEIFTIASSTKDQPPSYEQVNELPPCFCTAVKSVNGNDDNIACSCGKGNTTETKV